MKNKQARKMIIHHLSEAHQQDFEFTGTEVTWNSWSKFFNCHIDQAAFFGVVRLTSDQLRNSSLS